jgi:hypothetical protein
VHFLLGPIFGAGVDFVIVAFLVFWFSRKILKEEAVTKKRPLRRNEERVQRKRVSGLNEEGDMEPAVFLAALLIFVGIPAFTVIKVARLRAARRESPSADVTARLEAVERGVQDLQHDLAETQERLDFAERLLSKTREERRIGS